MIGLVIIAVLIVLAVIFVVLLYNRMVALRNHRENAFADIDVQLKQRYDLIPQLVDAVKGYMKHEESVLTRVTEARANAIQAGSIEGKMAADQQLTSALSGLRVAVEAYPDLKANQNFKHLQEEISDVENKLAASRRFFNSATKEYNTSIEVFPANIVAGMFSFKREPMYDLGTEQRVRLEDAPKVKFD